MAKLSAIILSILLLFVFADDAPAPRGLVDDAKEQVNTLRSVIRGVIYSSFTQVDNMVRSVFIYRDESMAGARVEFQEEYQNLLAQIVTVENLAISAGQDPTVCVDPQKEILAKLPATLEDGLLLCLVFANVEVTDINNSARYYIDIIINEIEIFDYQLEKCGENFECISPILQQVELAEVELTEKIQLEVQKSSDLIDELKVLIKQCTDDSKAEMVSQGRNVVTVAAACVDQF